MPERSGSDERRRLANQVRKFAAGIFDHGERELVLRFVDACEERDRKPTGRLPSRAAD
jgi:hypothetical protein